MNTNQAVQKLEKIEEKLIHSHISKELFSLYFARVLLNISITTLGVFLPIYFYNEYKSIYGALAVFGLVYLVYIVILPAFAKLLDKLGIKKMMIAGMFFAILSVLVFQFGLNVWTTMAFVAFAALYRAFYWTPYQVDLVEFLDKKHKAGQLAFLRNLSSVITAISPFLGGYLIANYGFEALFYFISLAVFSGIVVLSVFVPDTKEHFSWGYLETYKHLFKKENLYLVLSQIAFGAQSVGFIVIWPVFIYILVSGDYSSVGLLTTLTLFAIIFLRFLIAKIFDKGGKEKALKLGVFFTSTGWFAKTFVNSPVDVLLTDTYHQVGREVNRIAFDSATYEQSADSGNYIDEFTILKEISLNLGRIAMIIISSVFIYAFGIKVAFVLAGIASLFMFLISKSRGVK